MNPKTKEYVCRNLKWPLKSFSYIGNYFILIFPIVMIYFGVTEYDRNNPPIFLLSMGIFLFLFVFYQVEKERKFKALIFSGDLSTSEIAKKLTKNGWSFQNQQDNVLKFYTSISLDSWGEIVTIIKVSPNKLLINSQPSGRSPFTFKSKINFDKIKIALESKSTTANSGLEQ